MPWSGRLTKVESDPTNGNILATLVMTDGRRTITERIPGNDISKQWLAGLVAARKAAYETRDRAQLALGFNIGLVVPAKAQGDPLQAAYQTLANLSQQVALGVKTTADPLYVAALANVKTLQAAKDAASAGT